MRNKLYASLYSLIVAAAIFVAVLNSGVAQAWSWSGNNSYFNAYPFESYSYYNPVTSVIDLGVTGTGGDTSWSTTYGCPNKCASKSDFVTFIQGKLGDPSSPVKASSPAQDKVGAEFLVSSMLNLPQLSGGGHAAFSYNSPYVQQWISMMNQGNVGMKIDYNMQFSLHTVNHLFTSGRGWDVEKYLGAQQTVAGLEFYNKTNNQIFTKIELRCANIADTPAPPPAPSDWSILGKSYVNTTGVKSNSAGPITVVPGQTIYWYHDIRNATNDGANANLSYWVKFWSGSTSAQKSVTMAPNQLITQYASSPGTDGRLQYYVQDKDVGKTFCENIYWNPASSAVSSDGSSTPACATVVSNADMYPNVNGWGTTLQSLQPLQQGATSNMSVGMYNSGSKEGWGSPFEIHQFVVPSSVANKPAFDSLFNTVVPGHKAPPYTVADFAPGSACTGWLASKYPGDITKCTELGSGSQDFWSGYTNGLASATINAANYNPGDWVCVFGAVSRYSTANKDNSTSYRVNHPVCVVIAKEPEVQFLGDDVHAGDNITGLPVNNNATVFTSHFNAQNSVGQQATFGSWAEYGIFAPARISSISGGAVSGPNGYAPAQIPDLTANPLSFANTGVIAGYPYGDWGAAQQIPSIESFAAQYPATSSVGASSLDLSAMQSLGVGTSSAKHIMRVPLTAANTNLAGNFTANGVAILESQGTVTITGNINLQQQPITSLGSAAQVIIIADKIIVNSNVTNIDAWLVARPTVGDPSGGQISTCDSIMPNYIDGLTLGVCNAPLQINGALMAREVQFRRTYGADKTTGYNTPAEVVNLRADAYMWAQPASAGSGGGLPIETTFTTELPPRY